MTLKSRNQSSPKVPVNEIVAAQRENASSVERAAVYVEGLKHWSIATKLSALWGLIIFAFQMLTLPNLIAHVGLKWTDYQSFYRAGKWVLGSQTTPLYPLTSFSGQSGPAADLHLCMNPPHFILAFSPLSFLPMRAAYLVFAFFNIGCLLATLLILRSFCRTWRPGHFFCVATLLAGSPFVSAALSQGTVSIPITLCLIVVVRADLVDHPTTWRGWLLPGICLGFITMKPQYLILAGVYLAARRQWKVLAIGTGAGAAWFCASTAIMGLEPWLRYPRYLQVFTEHLDTFDTNERGSYWVAEQMINARGAFVRILGFEQAKLINTLSIAVLVLAMCLVAVVGFRVRKGQLDPVVAWCLISLATVTTAGHTNPPDGVTLLLPFVLGWSVLRSQRWRTMFGWMIPSLTIVPYLTFGPQNRGSLPLFGLGLMMLTCTVGFVNRSRGQFTVGSSSAVCSR
jgi:Glycosyltransferase family 87